MEGETERKKGERNEDEGKVPMYQLFKFADRTDLALMVVGTVAALASGASQPLMTLTFGMLIDAFGRANIDDVLTLVNKVQCLNLHLLFLLILSI
jgi:ATP-binding cassette, subfamily B (MDR/TAP), member 1